MQWEQLESQGHLHMAVVKEEISEQIHFQEQYFDSEIVM